MYIKGLGKNMGKSYGLGKEGEEIVCKYLKSKQYKILEMNFNCKIGEIDIIAIDKDCLCFIEVKTRTNDRYGLPAEAVTNRKLKHIYKTAEYYIYTRKIKNIDIRIDVIEVYFIKGKWYINHLKKVI